MLALPAVAALTLGAALSVAGIGLPLLLAAATFCRALERLDRRAANRWLGAQVPPIPRTVRRHRRRVPALARTCSRDRSLWRTATHLALRPVLFAAMLVVALAAGVRRSRCCCSSAIGGLAGAAEVDYVGPWTLDAALGLVLLALALPAGALALAALETLYRVLAVSSHALLIPRMAPGGPVREMLAESLGDRTVSVVYWLPDRERFVDEQGRPVELPQPGSGRAWTAVDRDGRRLAAIIHDAALDTSPELVMAAAAASSLAIDNERLKADLQARVEELRLSRLRIIEAGDAARRRIERDLHDGAQQQLVSLALDLRMLKARLKDPQIDELSERLATALAELRELARGIHPAILTDRGLAPAIQSLADRGTVPIDDRRGGRGAAAGADRGRRVLPRRRGADQRRPLRGGVERARWSVRRAGDELIVEVADDGVGGVDPSAGSGIRGLRGPRRGGRRDARDRLARWPRHAAARDPSGARMKRFLLLAAARCSPAAAGPRSCASPACRCPARRGRAGAGRAGARRRGADRGRHPRPGLEQVLGDHPQRRRLRGAPARRARRLQVARRLQRRADERADRPGGRDQARRPRRLDPVRGPRARDPARGHGRHPGDLDQLRQRRLQARSACSPTSARSRAAPGWRRAGGWPTRACRNALCLNQERDNVGTNARCAGLAKAMREAGGRARTLADRRRRPAHARA